VKFKRNNKGGSLDRELVVVDSLEDFLVISGLEYGHIYISVNDSARVQITKRRALAIARAIIEELS
jgi:hypothetical protein